jgi:hypothetical protein
LDISASSGIRGNVDPGGTRLEVAQKQSSLRNGSAVVGRVSKAGQWTMKITFYADVPDYAHHDLVIIATSRTFSAPASGYQRVTFEVDFPPGILKEADANALASATKMLALATVPLPPE